MLIEQMDTGIIETIIYEPSLIIRGSTKAVGETD